MTLWFVFALMTVAAIFAVLWPLSRRAPAEGRGWNVLAPVLVRLGRFDDAVRAYRNAITYGGDSAERRSDFGEALAGAAGGIVTAEAKAEFERAVAMNADDAKANYFLGL